MKLCCGALTTQLMDGSRGGGQGVRTPPPLKNHKNIGFSSNTGPDPLKITKLPSQHSMFFIMNTKHCITYLALTQLFPVLLTHRPHIYYVVFSWISFRSMTRPLPFIFSQSAARNGPYSVWYIFHTSYLCEIILIT